MPNTIFCPQNHLILNAPRCAECDWTRPIPGEVGQPAWGPLDLEVSLGGPGRGMAAIPAVAQGIAVFALRNGELIGVTLADGTIRWRVVLDAGMMTRHIVADGDRLLASIADERQIGAAENARLVSIQPKDGEITLLWEADGHQLTPPALSANQILVWSSSHQLVALSREQKPRELWRQKMNTWWSLAPFITGTQVLVSDGRAMHGDGHLVALNLNNGKRLWDLPMAGMLTLPPVALDEVLVFLSNRKQVTGLDLRQGKIIWQQDFKRIYSAPVAGDGLVYWTVRGTAGSGAPGHYLIVGLDPASGEVKSEIPLPANARARVGLIQGGISYWGTDDGRLLAYRLPEGQPLWAFDFHPDEEKSQDKIHTGLVIAQSILAVGTYLGKLAGVCLTAPSSGLQTPQDYMESGDFEAAAAAFALAGDLQRAAEVYVDQLQNLPKALLLYDRAGLYQPAGELALKIGNNMLASQYFEKSGNLLAEAKAYEAAGDLLKAAELYAQTKDIKAHKLAADLFEQQGEYRKALDMHTRIGSLSNVIRVFLGKVAFTKNDLEALENQGHLLEAAQIAQNMKEFAKAAKLYEKAEKPEQELGVLLSLIQVKPNEEWVWDRVVNLAQDLDRLTDVGEAAMRAGSYGQAAKIFKQAGERERELSAWQEFLTSDPDNPDAWHRMAGVAKNLGRFEEEAQAWIYFKNYEDAADAYQRAARQMEIRTPDAHERIAILYEQAKYYFDEMGLEEECHQCWAKIIQYRSLPFVIVEGQTRHAFREGHFNILEIQIMNIGRGVARNVGVFVGSGRFELDETNMNIMIRRLYPNKPRTHKVTLRPLQGEIGPAVPLLIEWRWQDRNQVEYEEKSTTHVKVQPKDAPSGGTPHHVEYHFHDQAVHATGENIEVVGRDKVGGDKFDGDKVEAGAQKGDKVEINRGQGVRLTEEKQKQTGPLPATGLSCPTCHLPVDLNDQFCQGCGNKIQAEDR